MPGPSQTEKLEEAPRKRLLPMDRGQKIVSVAGFIALGYAAIYMLDHAFDLTADYHGDGPGLFHNSNVDGVPKEQIADLEKDLPPGLKEVRGVRLPSLTPQIEADIIKTHGLAYQDPSGNWWQRTVTVKGNDVILGDWVSAEDAGGKPWMDKNGWHLHAPQTPPTPAPASPDAAYDKWAKDLAAHGARPVNEIQDITHDMAKFKQLLIGKIVAMTPGISAADADRVAGQIIEAGGYTDSNGVSYQLWQTATGEPHYVKLPVPAGSVDSLPAVDKKGGWEFPEPETTSGERVDPQESIQGPNGSETEEREPIQKTTAPKVKPVTYEAYKQAELNLGGVDTDGDGVKDGIATRVTDSETIRTPRDSTELVQFLRERGIEVTPEQAADILEKGGYSVNGRQFELWISKTRTGAEEGLPVFYTAEKPGVEYPAVSGTPVVVETIPVEPTAEVTDGEKYELSNATIVLKGEPMSHFDGPNPYDPGTPEYKAWADIHTFLTTHDDKALGGWEKSNVPVDTYLADRKFAPKYEVWPPHKA